MIMFRWTTKNYHHHPSDSRHPFLILLRILPLLLLLTCGHIVFVRSDNDESAAAAADTVVLDSTISEEDSTPTTSTTMIHPTLPQMIPGIQLLTDTNFEHLTQASTGQTTGSWLIWFTETIPNQQQQSSKDDTNREKKNDEDTDIVFEGIFPSEEEWLNNNIVVAVVDATTLSGGNDDGIKIRERFRINNLPTFLLIHNQGKMYRYPNPTNGIYHWDTILKFCQNPNVEMAESIPPPQSWWHSWQILDNFSDGQYRFVKEAGFLYVKIMIGLVVVLVVGLFIKATSEHFRSKNHSGDNKEKQS